MEHLSGYHRRQAEITVEIGNARLDPTLGVERAPGSVAGPVGGAVCALTGRVGGTAGVAGGA